MGERTLRWGILGTGNIARQFAAGMKTARRGLVTAVASRTAASAEAFARTHGIGSSFASYGALIAARDVDAVYLSAPNTLHHEWTIAALRAGKHVLCEKPFAVTWAQAEEMFEVAARAGRVVMEAFMYRCHPQTLGVLEAVRSGAIGEVRLIRASFCFKTSKIDGNIRFRPDLAGGSLMDVGCYCTSFARLVAGGEPTQIHAAARIHPSGVDEMAAGLLGFGNGVSATFACGMTVQADNTASICGTEGYIEIPVPWKPPTRGAKYIIGRSTPPRMDSASSAVPAPPPRQEVAVEVDTDLYALEADDFAASVLDGRAVRVSRSDTVGNVRVLETLRKMVGLSY